MDGKSNQLIGLDKDLKEVANFEGICFNQCGFASTEVVTINATKSRIFWHKGKGRLSMIDLKDRKEIEYDDSITGNNFILNIK